MCCFAWGAFLVLKTPSLKLALAVRSLTGVECAAPACLVPRAWEAPNFSWPCPKHGVGPITCHTHVLGRQHFPDCQKHVLSWARDVLCVSCACFLVLSLLPYATTQSFTRTHAHYSTRAFVLCVLMVCACSMCGVLPQRRNSILPPPHTHNHNTTEQR